MAAYAAGLIDGEGCISIVKDQFTVRIDVGMSEAGLGALRTLERWLGGKIDKGREATDQWAATFRWRLIGTACEPVLSALLPYLVLKWEQARLALSVQALRSEMPVGKTGRPEWTPELRARAQRMRDEVMRLNRKGPVTESWPAGAIARLVGGAWLSPQLSMFDDLGYAPFSGTWPRAGSMRNGIIYPLQPLAPLTRGIASGLLPTPAVTEYGSSQNGINGKGGAFERPSAGTPSLSTMARRGLWPTPTVQDSENDGGPSQFERNSLPLNAAVKVWPTPKSTISGPDFTRAGRERSGGDDLVTAVARDGDGGSLNPTWVEWLMGFPLGWTDLEALATPSCPTSPSGSDEAS